MKAIIECSLKGFIINIKNITKTKVEILKFNIILKPGIRPNSIHKSVDNNAPNTRKEHDLKNFRNFSFRTLSIRDITNIMKKEASAKLRMRKRFKLAKYRGHVMKLI